ncbi:TonB-dependent siderophore receptor [Vandammella animalimorsus]|uniref:TonB-dependent siderophore receptor n=1 Tax=Vandammella animalimorsus TaxID=2029117 RepID=UPI00117BE1C8|nr:TonB-dependent siderophore receptor [Vandammella animalimorsus]
MGIALQLLLLGGLAQAQGAAGRPAAQAQELPAIEVVGDDAPQSYVQKQSSAATGLALDLRETPQTVSVITQQRMRDQQTQTVGQALEQVSGLTTSVNDDNRQQIVSRGFEVENFRIDGNLLDSNNTRPNLNLSAMYERIEVTKGATGLLSGTGDPSATVNLVRKRADRRQFTAELDAHAGSWKNLGLAADIASPLNAAGTLRSRLVLAHQRGEGFRDLKKDRLLTVYGTVEADLSAHTRLSLGLSHERKHTDGSFWGSLPFYFSDGTRTNWRRSQTTAARWNRWDLHQSNAFAELEHSLANGWQWQSALNYTRKYEQSNQLWLYGSLDRHTGLGLQGEPYLWKQTPDNIDFNTGLTMPFQSLGFAQQASIRLHYNRFKGGWKGGGEDANLLNPDESSGDVIGNFFTWDHHSPAPIWGELPTGSRFTTTQKSVSFASRLQLAQPLKLILGGRYSHWERDNQQAAWTPQAYVQREKVFVPYLGVVYDLTPNLAAYASYASMFKPQEKKDRHGHYLAPVRGNTVEAGLKGAWLNDRLQGTLALYQTRQDNFAAPDEGHVVPGTTDTASRAVKGAKVRGYELEVNGRPHPRWDVSAGWSQYSAKEPDGSHLNAHQSRKVFKLFAKYDASAQVPGLSLGAGLRWHSRPPIELENPGTGVREAAGQPAYALVDLMARYQVSPRLALQLNVHNALDKSYYQLSQWWTDSMSWGEPRRVQLSLNYLFD